MEKRIVVFVVLCLGIFILWGKIFPPAPPPAPPAADPRVAQTTPAAPSASQQAAPSTPRGPEELVTFDGPHARFVLSSYGGTLKQVVLKDPKFLTRKGDPDSGLNIVRATGEERASLRTTFANAEFGFPDRVAWTVNRPTPDTAVFTAETESVTVEKRYRLLPESYQLALEVEVRNKADKTLAHGLVVHVYGAQDPERKGGGWLDYASANVEEMACHVNGKVERDNIGSLLKEPEDLNGTVRWVAADERFFTLAAVALPDAAAADRRCGRRALDEMTGEAFLSFPRRTVEPGKSTTYALHVFAGPKYREALASARPGGQDVELEKLINVSFEALSRPMLWVLKKFNGFTGNWGIAIILLTILVKLITFYPAHKAMMSGKRMARLQPKLMELRKKYEGDRERLARETMNLYKSNGVSMFGGCLPSLLQMPIWIALYSTLSYAVELYRSAFFGYIVDLSARDPYFVTPILMGIVMVIQMRMTPAGADPQQQKMMSVMMPIMFTAFSLFLPSGLAVYMLTSYMLGIVHQLVVNRIDKRNNPAPVPVAPANPAKA